MAGIKGALVEQYLAGLKMLRETIELCPDELWQAGEHPRNYWRIAYHTIYYTHLYLQPNEAAFVPWSKHREDCPCLWEEPPVEEAYSREETLLYLDDLVARVPEWVERIDLNAPDTGFSWYSGMNKLDHQLMNLRHLQGHVGQLSELLMSRGIDTDWRGVVRSA